MYNDMGNVDHLITHPLTYLPTYLLPTILQFVYYLLLGLVVIWNEHMK
jgi:hypothetical protein